MKYLLVLVFLPFFTFSQSPQFNSRGLLILSDGDMDPSSFYYDKINFITESVDNLIGVSLPLTFQNSKFLKKNRVSNSMISNFSCFEISNSQPRIAYILETKGSVKQSEFSLSNSFEKGSYISVVDVSDINNIKPLFKFPVASNPISISLSPTGEYLAVCSEEYDNELQIIEMSFEGKPVRKIKKPVTFGNDRISSITWTNDGNYLVYSNESKQEVGLISIVKDAPTQKIIRLETFGQPIKLGVMPGKGHFTSDDRFYIISDLKKKKTLVNDNSEAELFVVKFSFDGGQHYLLSKQSVGKNLENFIIHPSNNYVFALASNDSFFPDASLQNNRKAKLSLLDLTTDGTLILNQSFVVEGSNPSGMQLDNNGQHLAIAISSFNNFGENFGGIEFWTFDENSGTKLKKQPNLLYLLPGVHTVKSLR